MTFFCFFYSDVNYRISTMEVKNKRKYDTFTFFLTKTKMQDAVMKSIYTLHSRVTLLLNICRFVIVFQEFSSEFFYVKQALNEGYGQIS